MRLKRLWIVRKSAEYNPFMPDTSWYGALCRKLRTPQLPPVLDPSNKVLGFAMLLSVLIAFSQGLDYIARPPETAPTLSIIEQMVTLDFWGTIFLVFAGLALVGGLFSIWPAAILGHGVLAFNYLAISLGIGWSLIDDWQGYGWNTGVIYLAFAVFHALVADGCYDEWAREWDKAPPAVEVVDIDGHTDL